MNKTLRYSIVFLCILALLLPSIAGCGEIEYAVVSEGNEFDGYTYTLYENGSAAISGGTADSDGKLTIPETIDGHKVIGIADEAFRDKLNFLYLKIEGSGISIGKNAFYGCEALTVADIGGASEIGDAAFYMCRNLTYIRGSENAKSIGNTAFCGCLSLTQISFGNKLTVIGDSAFQNCSALSSVVLPSSLKTLGEGAFEECSSLGYADISSLTSVPDGCFVKCTSLSDVRFSSKLSSLGTLCFRACSSLCTLTLPKTLKTVGDSAFAGCDSLSTVNYAGSESAWSGIVIAEGNEQLLSIRPYCNYSDKAAGKTNFETAAVRTALQGSYSQNGYTYVLFDDGCAQITAYDGAAAVLSIPDSFDGHRVVSIGEAVFSEKTALSSVTLPDTLEEICTAAFYMCSSLSSVSGGKNLRHIGHHAFDGTSWLENSKGSFVTLGSVLVAYRGTDKAVIIPSGIGYIADAVFSNNTSITSVNLGEDVVCIGRQAFAYCGNLTSITGNSVRHIEDNAFVSCEKLMSVEFSNVEKVGEYSFADCNSLRFASFGDRLETLSSRAFYSCINLRVLYVPETLSTLRADSFEDCVCFILLYPGSYDEYISKISGEGTLNLADLVILSDW